MVEKPPWPAAARGRRARWTLARSIKTKANGHAGRRRRTLWQMWNKGRHQLSSNKNKIGRPNEKKKKKKQKRRNYLHSPMVHYNKIRWRGDHRIASYIRSISLSLFASHMSCTPRNEKKRCQTTTIGKRDLRQSRVIIDANSLLCETVKLDNNETTDIAVVPGAKHTQMLSIQLIYLRISTK